MTMGTPIGKWKPKELARPKHLYTRSNKERWWWKSKIYGKTKGRYELTKSVCVDFSGPWLPVSGDKNVLAVFQMPLAQNNS